MLSVKFLTDASIEAFFPFGVTVIEVVFAVYPIPVFATTTSVIFSFATTALNFAPIPDGDTTVKSGADVNSFPPLVTCTLIILPPEINGLSSAFLPVLIEISGFLWKFNTVDPYPVPDS